MKIYLDTNIIHSWFRNSIRAKREDNLLKEPEIVKFLKNNRITLIVSEITKIEIARFLKSELSAKEEEIKELWNTFLTSFDINFLEIDIVNFKELYSLVLQIPTRKKTIVNLMHLQIAKQENVWFLTGENKLITRYKKYYDKSISYPELRKRLSSS